MRVLQVQWIVHIKLFNFLTSFLCYELALNVLAPLNFICLVWKYISYNFLKSLWEIVLMSIVLIKVCIAILKFSISFFQMNQILLNSQQRQLQLYITENMSNSNYTDQQFKNFVRSHAETPYQNLKSSLDQSFRLPLKENEVSKNYANNFNYSSTLEKDNIQNLRFNSFFTPRQRPKISIEQLLDEIRKLNEVICNLGRDNDLLKQEYSSLQFQMSSEMQKQLKQKQVLQADIRLLKEMLNDKVSQRQSCEKTGRKERQLIEQQCERLRNQVKQVIEKKNDEIFSITRDKDSQNQSIKVNFQNQIDELKKQHKNSILSFQVKNQELEDGLRQAKQKQNSLIEQIERIKEKNEQQRLKKLEEQEVYIQQLKSKYHNSKMILIQTSKQEIHQMENKLKIHKDIFLSEIEQLNSVVQRQQKENESIKQMMKIMGDQYQSRLNGYQSLIAQLEAKMKKVYQQKNQQIQIMKVKNASVHSQDINNIQNIYSSKIAFLQNKINNLERQIQNLHLLLDSAYRKNLELVKQKQQSDARAQQEIVKMRLSNRNSEQFIRDQMQAQKTFFVQQIEQIIKTNQIKSTQILTYEKQLVKVRNIIDQKINENQRLEKQLNEKDKFWNLERQKLKQQIQKSNKEYQVATQIQKQKINLMNLEIQKLNKEILQILSRNNEHDVIKYEEEINKLKQQLKDKIEGQKNLQFKLQSIQQKIGQLNQQKDRFNQFISVTAKSSKAEWQILSSQKIEQIEELYQKKLQFLEVERDQLKQINSAHLIHINSLTLKYQELEGNLRQIMESLDRKCDFENKIVELGLDNNLVKNKQELFQN